jgi:hypothetical protein
LTPFEIDKEGLKIFAVYLPESNIIVNDPPQKESAEHRETEILVVSKGCQCRCRWLFRSATVYFVTGFEVAGRGVSAFRDVVYMLAVISRLVTVLTTPENLRSIVFQMSWEAMSPPPSLHILLQQVCILVVIKLANGGYKPTEK